MYRRYLYFLCKLGGDLVDIVNDKKIVANSIKITYGDPKVISNRKNDRIVNIQKKPKRP